MIAALVAKSGDYKSAMRKIAKLDLDLAKAPFVNTLWDLKLERINPKSKVLVRDMLLVKLGVITDKRKIKKIEDAYSQVVE
ncbi:MAG: hypothetical protein GY751_00635 [Bacteroidetes bacterium]|nr:hypothetical protein [Bacteroidota bacterium]